MQSMRSPFLAYKQAKYRAPKKMQDHEHQQATYAATACQISDRYQPVEGKRLEYPRYFAASQIESCCKYFLHAIL